MVLFTPARAAEANFGFGIEIIAPDTFTALPLGVHAFGRVDLGQQFAIELAVEATLPGGEVSSLATTVVDIAYQGDHATTFQQPVEHLLGAASIYGEASPWRRRWDGVVDVWPYLLLGCEGLLLRTDYVVAAPTPEVVTTAPARLTPALVQGVGIDLWVHQRYGIRLLWMGHEWLAPSENYDSSSEAPTADRLWAAVSIAVDGMVRF